MLYKLMPQFLRNMWH